MTFYFASDLTDLGKKVRSYVSVIDVIEYLVVDSLLDTGSVSLLEMKLAYINLPKEHRVRSDYFRLLKNFCFYFDIDFSINESTVSEDYNKFSIFEEDRASLHSLIYLEKKKNLFDFL